MAHINPGSRNEASSRRRRAQAMQPRASADTSGSSGALLDITAIPHKGGGSGGVGPQ